MLKQEVTEHLINRLIPFWQGLKDSEHGGYYGFVGNDLAVDRKAPKGGILNSRILWFFSRAARTLDDASLVEYARQAYEFMQSFWDKENGGLYWSCTFDGAPLDCMKHTYAQAFAVYALSEYYMASGEREALERALELYWVIETKAKHGDAYGEAYNKAYTPDDNARLSDNPVLMTRGMVAEQTMNTLLHLLEAYTALYEACGSAQVRQSLLSLLHTLTQRVYNRDRNRLDAFLDADMRPLIDMQSYGHDIEASWLIDLAADTALQGGELSRVKEITARLASGVIERALKDGSLLYEISEGTVDDRRIWWVQAEAVVGLVNLWQKTGDASALADANGIWDFIKRGIIDPREGSEWFESVSASGVVSDKPIVDPWKCPYHNGRMCLELIKRL